MKVVYKFIINDRNTEIKIHKDAKILKASFQGDDLCLWADVDTEKEKTIRDFYIFGTGQEITDDVGIDFEYIDTVFIDNLVFHVYERHDS